MTEELELDGEGNATLLGTAPPHKGRIVAWSPDGALVVKVPGRHYYGGLGRPENYAPATFELYQVLETDGQVLEVRRRARWYVTQPTLVLEPTPGGSRL